MRIWSLPTSVDTQLKFFLYYSSMNGIINFLVPSQVYKKLTSLKRALYLSNSFRWMILWSLPTSVDTQLKKFLYYSSMSGIINFLVPSHVYKKLTSLKRALYLSNSFRWMILWSLPTSVDTQLKKFQYYSSMSGIINFIVPSQVYKK